MPHKSQYLWLLFSSLLEHDKINGFRPFFSNVRLMTLMPMVICFTFKQGSNPVCTVLSYTEVHILSIFLGSFLLFQMYVLSPLSAVHPTNTRFQSEVFSLDLLSVYMVCFAAVFLIKYQFVVVLRILFWPTYPKLFPLSLHFWFGAKRDEDR